MDWSDGYKTDVTYAITFFRKMAPAHMAFAALMRRQQAPDPAKPFRYAELGCGQGLGPLILAATHPHAEVMGFDFLPGHVASARALAEEAGLPNVSFREDSFEQAAALPDDAVPRFDIIALHGVYTWVNEDNRRAIVRFIDRRLNPGGLVYISYNCLPGWAPIMPFQRLLIEHARRHPGASGTQVLGAMTFIEDLLDRKLEYFTRNPRVAQHIRTAATRNIRYLVHEYMHTGWAPVYVTDVADALAGAKLSYLCAADVDRTVTQSALPEGARDALRGIEDPVLRELVHDFAVDRFFRADIYVKGPRPLTSAAQHRALRTLKVAPVVPRATMGGPKTPEGGEDTTARAVLYDPIADVLADGPASLGEIADRTGISLGMVVSACAVMVGRDWIQPVVPGIDPAPARRLNRVLADHVLTGVPIVNMAAPLIGSGLPASDLDLAALDILSREDVADASDLAGRLRARLQAAGRPVVHDGKTIDDPAEAERHVAERAAALYGEQAPVWRHLGLL
ncbi:class I SAM-dependent methyltransferase [Roseospira goensis]|uniref:SAM-dependent methyltransferase n=1 Tax=Roseospira goensis TaxID=391922 RepID=A0A7W6WJL6_9PROT|nr:class I SAM-dependent methyltransferase [Roseospira goensis]MBB4284638.1 SAM-dependent methyltransferase [Roseospira goensis]